MHALGEVLHGYSFLFHLLIQYFRAMETGEGRSPRPCRVKMFARRAETRAQAKTGELGINLVVSDSQLFLTF